MPSQATQPPTSDRQAAEPSHPLLLSGLDTDLSSLRTRWGRWALFWILAFALHGLLIWLQPVLTPPSPAPPVRIETVDPRKLEEVRKQWAREKSLLLNKDKSAPRDVEAPEDARYFSDRNIRVQKEQRAKDTQVVPRPGRPQPRQSEAQPAPRQPRPNTRLSDLGVALPKPRAQVAPQAQTRAGQEGGDQALADRDLPLGGENMLNAQESVYYSFYARLYEAIGPLWQSLIRRIPYRRRVPPGEYSTVVDVVMDKDGRLLEVRQLQSSGIPEFDQSVPEAWNKVGRFPNPPTGLLNGDGEVHTGWTFTVHVDQHSGFDYLPPERVY